MKKIKDGSSPPHYRTAFTLCVSLQCCTVLADRELEWIFWRPAIVLVERADKNTRHTRV